MRATTQYSTSVLWSKFATLLVSPLLNTSTATATPKEITATGLHEYGVYNDTRKLQEDLDFKQNVTFLGIDNDLVTMAETVPFGINRYKFHLNLFRNQYLDKDGRAELLARHDKGFLLLPESPKIKSEDIDVTCGYRDARLKLQRKKHSNEEIKDSQIKFWYPAIFYNNAGRRAENRHMEIQSKAGRNKICLRERQFVVYVKKESLAQIPKPKPTLMIGDAGLEVGSTIRGFRHYGGTWKQSIRGHTRVCRTSEYMTSQTFMICFSKLTYPIAKQTVDGKIVARTCILRQYGKYVFVCDRLSALVISLPGLNQLLYQSTFLQFGRGIDFTYAESLAKTLSFSSGRDSRASA